MHPSVWPVAVRPGQPRLHRSLDFIFLLAMPGNPVSSIVCAILFLIPAIRALLGDPKADEDPSEDAILGADLPANRERQDYMRASLALQDVPLSLARGAERLMLPVATPHLVQDSSMLSILERSDALLVRPPHAPAASAGEPCRIIRVGRFC